MSETYSTTIQTNSILSCMWSIKPAYCVAVFYIVHSLDSNMFPVGKMTILLWIDTVKAETIDVHYDFIKSNKAENTVSMQAD